LTTQLITYIQIFSAVLQNVKLFLVGPYAVKVPYKNKLNALIQLIYTG